MQKISGINMQNVTADNLLAFGCGTGIVSNTIAPHVKSVTGIDIAENMIAQAVNKAAEQQIENITYLLAGLEDAQIQAQNFSVITAFNVLYFLKDMDQKLRLIYDMLPEGGYFLSVTDCAAGEKGLKGFLINIGMRLNLVSFVAFLSTDELVGHVKDAGFQIIHVENLYPEPPNLYIVARK